MNYLAHLFLAENTPDSLLGNFLGDFVKGSLESHQNQYNSAILKGIKTHRKIDTFTDTHPIFIKSKRRICKDYRHFSGIVIDIAYDHFLANHWQIFSPEPLEEFITHFYQILQIHQTILPPSLQAIIPRIISENWLLSYQTLEELNFTFTRISRRLKTPNPLPDAGDAILTYYDALTADFLEFFPHLIHYTQQLHLNPC